MAKRTETTRRSNNKRCTCGATTPKEHIEASMMGAGVHPYTGPRF